MIFLISCSSAKLAHAAPARDLYSASALFTKSLAFAELRATPRCAVYVVSALHHLVTLDQVLEPYELSLLALSPREREAWGERVHAQLVMRHRVRNLCVLAGVEYVNAIGGAYLHERVERDTRYHVETPLAGMQIGQRLAWLNAEIARLSDHRARTSP